MANILGWTIVVLILVIGVALDSGSFEAVEFAGLMP